MRAVAFLLSSVTACRGSGSARWMGTEEPGLWHSTGKRKEGAFSWIQLVSSFGSYCVLWGKFGLLWSKETPGLLSWQGQGGRWLTVGFRAQPNPQGQVAHCRQSLWAQPGTLADSSTKRGRSGARRAQKPSHRRTQVTLYFPGPVGDTPCWPGQVSPGGFQWVQSISYMTHMWCCLSWTDTNDTIYEITSAPASRRHTVNIFFQGNSLNYLP